MSDQPQEPASRPKLSRAHLAARFSLILAFASFAGNCVANQLAINIGIKRMSTLTLAASIVTSGLVFAGLGLGIYGFREGRRSGVIDTQHVALLGIMVNLGIIGLTLFGLWLIAGVR